MNRREFLYVAAGVPLLIAAAPGAGSPYGELLAPDANGIMLPPGFTARVVARAGEVVPGTKYAWHQFPDGGANVRAGRQRLDLRVEQRGRRRCRQRRRDPLRARRLDRRRVLDLLGYVAQLCRWRSLRGAPG